MFKSNFNLKLKMKQYSVIDLNSCHCHCVQVPFLQKSLYENKRISFITLICKFFVVLLHFKISTEINDKQLDMQLNDSMGLSSEPSLEYLQQKQKTYIINAIFIWMWVVCPEQCFETNLRCCSTKNLVTVQRRVNRSI